MRIRSTTSPDALLPPLLATVALAQAAVQLTLFLAPGVDDAQLILWAQAPRWGVLDQPAAFSNIAWALSQLGVPVAAVPVVLRQLFLAGAVLLLRAALGRWTPDATAAWLGAMAVTLLPDMHRNGLTTLTHVPFMIFALALAFRAAVACAEAPSARSYAALGLAAGLLPHAKYNALAFAVLLPVLATVDRYARRMLADRRILLSLALFALLAVPPLVWLALNGRQVARVSEKFEMGAGALAVLELARACIDSFKYLAVFAVAAAALRWRAAGAGGGAGAGVSREGLGFLLRYAILFFAVAALVATAADFGVVKRRWILPGAFFVAVLGGLWAATLLAPRRRAILLALLTGFWLYTNVKETAGELSLGEDRPGPMVTDHSALVRRLADLARSGDVLIGSRTLVADAVRRLDGITGWAGETRPPLVVGRVIAVWQGDDPPDALARQLLGTNTPPLRPEITLDGTTDGFPDSRVTYGIARLGPGG